MSTNKFIFYKYANPLGLVFISPILGFGILKQELGNEKDDFL
jgi:hypothetical protein